MKTKIIGVFLLLSQFSFSQDIPTNAAPLFASTNLTGTARTVGSGGAYGSVGADMGCISINPAGLGLYRSTDFSISPLLQVGSNESVYDGNHTVAHKVSFGIAQGGFVFTKLFKKTTDSNTPMNFSSERPLRSISFALNFQQQALFDRSQQYGVSSNSQSLIQNYVSQMNASGIGPNAPAYFPPEVQLAGDANLFSYNQTTNKFSSNVVGPVSQAGDIEERGTISRIDAALGTNLFDKIYIGIDLAVPIIGYNLSTSITETTGNTNGITDYTTNPVTSESGYGFNGIIGLIYRPLPWLRLGAAYHLPTWYAMTENYNLNFNEDSSIYNSSTGSSPISLPAFPYALRTPMKGDFGASFYYKELGFISVDYDVQNLGATMIHVPNDSLGFEPYYNQGIKSTYGYQHTVHAGLEAALVKVLRLRAGYAYSSSPYKKDQEVTAGYTGVRNAFTAGIGVRLKHFYADLAYVYSWTKDGSYQLTNDLPVNSIYNANTVLLTIGWRFEAGAKNNDNQQKQQKRYTPPPVDNDQRY